MAAKLDRLQVLDCERPSLIPAIKREAMAHFSKDNYEQIMRTSDGDDRTIIYQRQLGKGKNEFVLLNEEKNELQIVNIVGSVSLNDIKMLDN
ncbi:MAG TPA: DUF4252 domain-containing protein [Prevotella sp.]